MATWTDITDAALEPGKPIRSVDGLALRDNVTALAEGAAGAPSLGGGIAANGAAGAVGTYAFAYRAPVTNFGALVAGSSINISSTFSISSTSLSGTWRCLGQIQDTGESCIFLRIS